MKRTYKVLNNYMFLDKDSIITEKYSKLFETVLTNGKYNFIINKSELLDNSKYILINT